MSFLFIFCTNLLTTNYFLRDIEPSRIVVKTEIDCEGNKRLVLCISEFIYLKVFSYCSNSFQYYILLCDPLRL